ncbi:MAG: hypothetical protein PGN13_06960 [Patulibacter minatonensis]
MSKERVAPRAAGLCLLAAGLGTAVIAPSASATVPVGASSCQASALDFNLLGTGWFSPISAASAPCEAEHHAVDVDLLGAGAVKVTAVEAGTEPAASGGPTSTARVAGLDLGIGAVSDQLAAPLISSAGGLRDQFQSGLGGALAPGGPLAGALAPLTALGLDTSSIDAAGLAAQVTNLPALLDATLPNLATADVITATARATCANGRSQVGASSDLTGLNVLGTAIDPDDPANRAITLDSSRLTLSQLVSTNDVLRTIKVHARPNTVLGLLLGAGERSLYDLLADPGGLLGAIDAALPVGTTVQSILDRVSDGTASLLAQHLDIPANLLQVKVTPHVTADDGTTATSTAVTLDVTIAGRSVLSGNVARASVTAGATGCGGLATPVPTGTPRPPVTPTPAPNSGPQPPQSGLNTLGAQALLQCSDAPVRLVDVRRSGGRTLVKGIAQLKYAGQTASIVLTHTGRTVGTAKIAADGSFQAKVALPASKIRGTNEARYYAVVQARRSNKLKFARRMVVTRLSASGGRVTMRGYTTLPRARRQAPVVLQRRVTCTKFVKVGTVRPDVQGRFTATFKAPAGATYAIYRAQTRVPKREGSQRTFATYTLPQLATLR